MIRVYDKNHLVENLTQDVVEQLFPYSQYQGGVIDHVSIGNNFIQFDINQILYPKIKLDLSVKATLMNFKNIWIGRIFEGEEDCYMFGDILNNSHFETIEDVHLGNSYVVYLRFEFYKIPYRSYLDELPQDVVFVLLGKVSDYIFRSYTKLYPNIITEENRFRLLTKEKYPRIYNDIISVYTDFKPGEIKFYTWYIIYKDLVHLSRSDIDLYTCDLKPGNDRWVISMLYSHVKIKQNFPLMYRRLLLDDFSAVPSVWALFHEALSSMSSRSPLYTYIISGKFQPGYRIREQTFLSSCSSNPYIVAYLVVTDENVGAPTEENTADKFADWVDYQEALYHILKYHYLIDPLFDHLGLDRIHILIKGLFQTLYDRSENIGQQICGYVLRKRDRLSENDYKLFIHKFGIDILLNLMNNSFDESDVSIRESIMNVVGIYR